MSVLRSGAKFVEGTADTGRLILVREDGTRAASPVYLIEGSVSDNGDGTCDLILPEV